MRTILFCFLFLTVYDGYSQDAWATWDQNYQVKNYDSLISSEVKYARKVESDPSEVQYYCRNKGYKFIAHYLGKSRPMDSLVLQSIQRVYKLTQGTWPEIKIVNEYLFEINGIEVWAPMQQQIEKAFKKEIKKNGEVTLYCAFFNEHCREVECILFNNHCQDNKLYNTLLVSEFHQ